MKGDPDEDAEKPEVAFIGQRSNDQMDEPTMFFRHADRIELENLRIHPIAEEPDCSSSSSFWGDNRKMKNVQKETNRV